MPEALLRVRNLTTRFFTAEGQINAVEDVSFDLRFGETLGIVGESGSGKSVTALSLMNIVDSPGRITEGEVWYNDPALAETIEGTDPDAVDGDFVDILQLPEERQRQFRGSVFSMIFQDPMSCFNPTLTVGEQIAEAVEVQRRASSNPRSTRARSSEFSIGSFLLNSVIPSSDGFVSSESREKAIELLDTVGIPDPAKRANEYPNQFSGGMLQRAMIAAALAGEPDVLLADEPTTALDVTIQAQILELLDELRSETDMSIVLITHNLGSVARACDRVNVMYAGEIIERGTLEDIFERPVHPYTNGLLGSIPTSSMSGSQLTPIEGNVPDLIDDELADRCYFADRCPKAMEQCLEKPSEYRIARQHATKCHLATEEWSQEKALPQGYFEGETDE